jgi:hypothetical protein
MNEMLKKRNVMQQHVVVAILLVTSLECADLNKALEEQ